MIKFKVRIKKDKVKKGFRDNVNYTVLSIDRDQLLLGDKFSRAIDWFQLEHIEFMEEAE